MGLPGGYAYPPGDMHISQETHRAQSTPAGASGELRSPGAL